MNPETWGKLAACPTGGHRTGSANLVCLPHTGAAVLRQSPSVPQRRFAPQDVMVVLGKAVGFVADVLQQPQGVRMTREASRLRLPGHEDFLLPLGQRDDERRLDADRLERGHRGAELPLAAVDQ